MDFCRVLDSLPLRWRPYFATLGATGLWEGELCDLQPENLDHDARAIRLDDSKTSTGARTIYVAEEFWSYDVASVPVPVTHSYLRAHWDAAVDRAGLREVSVTELQRLRSKLLAEAKEERPMIRLLGEEAREEARLLAQALPALVPTEDETRRLLLRKIEC